MNRFVTGRAQGVQNGRTPTPPLNQAGNIVRQDRASANAVKFTKKSGNSVLPTINPTKAYPSNQFVETFTSNQYQQAEHGQDINNPLKENRYHKNTLEDTTVDSDFERTKSDFGFEHAREQYDDGVDDRFSTDENPVFVQSDRRPYVEHAGTKDVHTIQYKQSRSPLVNTKIEPPSQRQHAYTIAGRFEGNKQHQALQLRNEHGNTDLFRDHGSKKRSRSRDEPRAPVTRHLDEESPGEEEDDDDVELLDGNLDATIRLSNNQISSDGTDQATPVRSPIRKRKSGILHPQNSQNLPYPENPLAETDEVDDRLLPDYSTDELKKMKYADLENESWDMVPHAKSYKLPEELQGRKVTLEKKIAYHVKSGPDKDQFPFYESLTTEEWEQAGDIFIEKFGELMKKLKAKKREKREAASKFENEIKEREKAVRKEAGKIDNRLSGMAITGQSLLRSK